MLRVILSGGPGVGKTTLLNELAARGYTVVEESAREFLRERRASGQAPRPEPAEFALELLRRDRAKYEQSCSGARFVFFDRCLVESIAMAQEAHAITPTESSALLRSLKFHSRVFILPPWEQIYTLDAERDQDFEHCRRVHEALTAWYLACGYQMHEVLRAPVRSRADQVLQVLAADGV